MGTPPKRRFFVVLLTAVLVAAAALGAGLMIVHRVQTGSWGIPRRGELAEISQKVRQKVKKTVAREAKPAPPAPPPVPHVIYLHKGPITLVGGPDDAANRVSSVVANAGKHSHSEAEAKAQAEAAESTAAHPPSEHKVSLRGYKGSKKSWTNLTKCVTELFAPFDVVVTDVEPPPDVPYILTVVAGKPSDIHYPRKASGLAPFSGELVPGAVVFVFSDSLKNKVQSMCEVLGMEVAHAYGVDHLYNCKDVMTYLKRCGKRTFVDKDVPCGEHEPRLCYGGGATQNSYQRLMAMLGPAKPKSGADAQATGAGSERSQATQVKASK